MGHEREPKPPRALIAALVLVFLGCTPAAPEASAPLPSGPDRTAIPSPGPTDAGATPPSGSDEEVREILRAVGIQPESVLGEPVVPVAQPGVPVRELLDAAVAEGRITSEQALLYEVFAVFGDERLPEEFSGAVDPLEGHHVLRRVAAAWSSLSEEARTALEPFFIPPIYTNSWAGAEPGAVSDGNDRSTGVAPPMALAAGGWPISVSEMQSEHGVCEELRERFGDPAWEGIDAADGKAVVWWKRAVPEPQDPGNPELVAKAARASQWVDERMEPAVRSVVAAVDESWPKFVDLMGREPLPDGEVSCYNGGDGRFDIYLTDWDLAGLLAAVVAYPPECTGAPAFGLFGTKWIKRAEPGPDIEWPEGESAEDYLARIESLPVERLLDALVELKELDRWGVAHELFHAFQFAYRFAGNCESFLELDEAVATWAGDLVYPVDNTEHRYGGGMTYSLFEPGGPNAGGYRDWVFILSLVNQQGISIIPAIYAKTESTAAGLEAIDEAVGGGLREVLPLFAEHAWNDEPITSFREWDELSDTAPADNQSFALEGEQRVRQDLRIVLKPMGRRYLDLSFAEDVRHIEIEQPDLGEEEVVVDALVRLTDGSWRQEWWTSADTIEYCREEADEDVDRIVAIWTFVGWPDIGNDYSPQVDKTTRATASDACPDPARGRITFSRERSGSYTSPRDNEVVVRVVDQATIDFDLEPDGPDFFTTVAGTVTWSYSLSAVEAGDDCTVIEEASGGGTFETGTNGPSLTLGVDEDFNVEPNAYLLSTGTSAEEYIDDDPSTHYHVSSTICSEELPLEEAGLSWWPYLFSGGQVSGTRPEGDAPLSGSRTRTVPAMAGGPDWTETVTWNVRLP